MSWKSRAEPVPSGGSWKDRAEPLSESPDYTGEVNTAVSQGLQGLGGGFLDEAIGAIEAGGQTLGVKGLGDREGNVGFTKPYWLDENKSLGDAYREGRDKERAALSAQEAANPNLSTGAQLAGAIAGPGKLVKGIPGMAAFGAGEALGRSEADLTEGQVGDAALDTALGGLLGGATGYAAPKLIGGAGKLVSKAGDALEPLATKAGAGLKKIAGRFAENATGATGKQMENFAEGAGEDLLEKGLVRFGDDAEKIAERVGGYSDEAGQSIGNALKELDQRGVQIDVNKVIGQIEGKIKELSSAPGNERLIKQLTGEIDNLLLREQDRIPVSMAEQAKRNFQSQVKWNNPDVENKAATTVSRAFKDSVEEAALGADESLGKGFQEAKKAYGFAAPIREAAERRAAVNNQSPLGGFGDVVTGGAGAALGGGIGAGAAVAGRRFVQPRLASSAAVTANNLGEIIKTSPQSLGRFAKSLQNAAQRGETAISATHYLLSSTDPEYRRLIGLGDDAEE